MTELKNPKKIVTQKIKLLPFQEDFVNDITTRYIALVGGLGTGKTTAACYKILKLFKMNPGCDGLGCEPTGSQLEIFKREMDKTCLKHNIKFTYNGPGGNHPAMYVFDFGWGPQTLFLLSANNYKKSLVGYNVAFAFCDEFDTIDNREEAKEIWQYLNSRVRTGIYNQTFVTTTPEGHRQVVDIFVKEMSPDGTVIKAKRNHRVIQVSTDMNVHLKPSYVREQKASFSAVQAQAKIWGKFVNVFGHRVYDCFLRERNSTDKQVKDFKANAILHTGVDFNIGNTSAVISIIEDKKSYVVDEIAGSLNTDTLIVELKKRYPKRVFYIYPDSSGKNRSSNADQASVSSITKLKAAFGDQNVFYRSQNPSIMKERVPAVNALFFNALEEIRCFVNIEKCPQLVKGLEQQGWKDGKPDKSAGLDHELDGFGYFCHYRFPVNGLGSIKVYG